jgi:hypothetical protein
VIALLGAGGQSSWEDVANGAEVLYRAVLLLDERLNRD